MILVTGGAGYIGSHCVLELLKQNFKVVIFDNFSTGHRAIAQRLSNYGEVYTVEGDLQNLSEIQTVFDKYDIDAVVHFAAFFTSRRKCQKSAKILYKQCFRHDKSVKYNDCA